VPSASGEPLGFTTVIVADADLVVSVTEVAVTVTVFPVGTAVGAVKIVAPPLAVCAPLNEPHAELPQVTVHRTPAFAGSFATFAVMFVVALGPSDVGGCAANVTVTGWPVIVIAAEADFVLSVTEVAVIVTVFPVGVVAGAVYVVAAPLAVEVEVNVPQAALPHVTVHFTPAFALSFATLAVMLVVPAGASVDGGCAAKVTATAGGPVIVIVAEADFVLSVTEVAVTVTEFPVGIAVGAVNVVAPPLAVCAGLNAPHAVLPHVAVHFTPAAALSLLTVAVRLVVALVTIDAGGAASDTEIVCTGGLGLEPPPDPPHPTITNARATTVNCTRNERRLLIAHLRSNRSEHASAARRHLVPSEPAIPLNCAPRSCARQPPPRELAGSPALPSTAPPQSREPSHPLAADP